MDLTALRSPLDPARTQDPQRFAMAGVAPRLAVRPESSDEVVEVVLACGADQLALLPWGGGIALSRENAPLRYDVALDMTGLSRVVEHEPDDFTITAECGARVQDLATRLATHGQELPLEAAEHWGATLGGVLAANASGPRRRRFGAPRDRILGARFVTGDGVLARTGGRVVKNVAGHAVHRLLVGSRGSLGVILEASLKLLPMPLARRALVYGMSATELTDAARWQGFGRREPALLTVIGRAVAALNPVLASEAAFAAVVGFEDEAAWVQACGDFTRERLGAPRLQMQDASVAALTQMLTDSEEMPGPRLSFATASDSPACLAPLLSHAVAERLVFHAPSGRLHLFPAAPEAYPLVTLLARHGFVLLEARGVELDPPPPHPATSALRARLRTALDPTGVFAQQR
ncbi:MAG: FAD-binding oxidoreductase [Candidatus Eisenbacteria bacterium]